MPLSVYYENDTPETFAQKIRSIQAFKGITTPSVKVDNGFIPDLQSRYFTADYPYGLEILRQIAEIYDVDCPKIETVLKWYYSLCECKNTFSLKNYGISDKEEFEAIYSL